MFRSNSFRWSVGCSILVVCATGWFCLRWNSEQRSQERIHSAGQQAISSGQTRFVLPAPSKKIAADQHIENLDPRKAGWDSEYVTGIVDQQLKRLTKYIPEKSWDAISEIAHNEFKGTSFSENQLVTIDDGAFQIRRLPVEPYEIEQIRSLKNQFESLVFGRDLENVVRCKFKIINIELAADLAETRLLIEFVQRIGESINQSNAVCDCEWVLDAGNPPRVRSWQIREFEQVRFTANQRTLFEDITNSVLGNTESFQPLVLRGLDHWNERLTGIDDMNIYGHHGIAVGDVNNDGLDDIYVCDSGGLPNRLYLQQPDGTALDFSRQSNTDWLESTTCAKFVDLDNDGDQDLVATTIAGILFASNNGNGVFKIRNAYTGMPEAHSVCAADYDHDGDLDLYVPNYGAGGASGEKRGFEAAAPIPYNDANNGGRNVLLENQGDFRFVDVTERCGLEMNNRRWSFAASWEDFDVDGDMDLYVANDFGRNNLYRNENGKFLDVANELGVEDMAGGMSVSWGDFNRDGRMDIYVGNMFSAAGNRVTYQRRFLQQRSMASSAGVQRMARGNTLFVANDDGTFSDVSEPAGVLMGRWAWSSKFADLNNDGWEDIVVANGYFTNDNPDDL